MKKRVVLSALFVLMGGLFVFSPVLAQNAPDPLGLAPGRASGLTDQDVRTTAASIINTILTVLGTIMLLLVFYAGFLWMTAAGNDDQIGKAKGILVSAIIGLIIILSAYSITTFVTRKAYQATTGGQYQDAAN